MIKVRYASIDGVIARRTYKTLKAAQAFAHDRIGAHPEIGTHYAVSGDGVGIIHVKGTEWQKLAPVTLADLFPDEAGSANLDDRDMEIALYGDGQVTTYYGQDGDPRNGERIYNSHEDDVAREARNIAEAAAWRKAMSPEDYGWDDLPF